jgi:septal ring factor EnvC (AmiA/AmiB activator)
MPKGNGDASASSIKYDTDQEIDGLQCELEDFRRLHQEAEQRIRELRVTEIQDRSLSLAKEIFETQQEKLRLQVEMEFRRKKINRLRNAEAELPF